MPRIQNEGMKSSRHFELQIGRCFKASFSVGILLDFLYFVRQNDANSVCMYIHILYMCYPLVSLP